MTLDVARSLDPRIPQPSAKPNFFLLGAGKCGTTTLASMLSQHPEVFMATPKEPSFFCSYFQVTRDPISYFNLFSERKNESAIGEASHVYFSNPETAATLQLLFPDAKFILILRNPTLRAYSLYQWMQCYRFEPLETFESALEAESTRHTAPEFFDNCPQYFWNFMYTRSSYYHLQWERYLRFFHRDRFFVLSLAELASDPVRWTQRIYAFLAVTVGFTPSTKHLNPGRYPEMQVSTRKQLDEHFKPTIRATQAIAGRDMQLAAL